MEANDTTHLPNDDSPDSVPYLMPTLPSDANHTLQFPPAAQIGLDFAGSDRSLDVENPYPSLPWMNDHHVPAVGDALHNDTSQSMSQEFLPLRQDSLDSELNDHHSVYGSVHNSTGSFDFASAFPQSEGSVSDAGFGHMSSANSDRWEGTGWEYPDWSADAGGIAMSAPSMLGQHFSSHLSDSQRPDSVQPRGVPRDSLSSGLFGAQGRYPGGHSHENIAQNSLPARPALAIPSPATENWHSMTPLDRWKHSPPEEEAASLTSIIDIIEGGATATSSEAIQWPSYYTSRAEPTLRRGHGSSPSVALSETPSSRASSTSGSSVQSSKSNRSHGSFGRFYVGDIGKRRRRRKAQPGIRKTSQRDGRPFQCTFCTDTFKSKYDWTRHEKTLHLSLEHWVCAPFGSTFRDPSNGSEQCAFCGILNPSTSHVETHRYSECIDKPAALRTFYRKDHIRQHLRLVHGIRQFIPSMDAWKTEVKNINSRCGFCDRTFVLWSERNDHIAHHFRAGAQMKDWKGCRGLDPPVALAVENAMPPYLIGIEAMGLEPFSASKQRRKVATARVGPEAVQHTGPSTEETKPTPFEYLTAQLGQFVQRAQARAVPVTDEMLQNEARCIVFGDEDPWNQTAADNPEWLKLFKEGMGLDSTASVIQPDQQKVSNTAAADGGAFHLPWSASGWTPYTVASHGPSCNLDSQTVDDSMPWSWQSPECLAEFRRCIMDPPTLPER